MTGKLRSARAPEKVLLTVALLVSGCGALRPLDQAPATDDRRPQPWSELEVFGHLRLLGSREVNGRATGSVGFAATAEYAQARMREYGLQPVAPGSWRHLYFTPLNSATDARVTRFGPDTLVSSAGPLLAADPRSAAGTVRSSRVERLPPGLPAAAPVSPILVVDAGDTDTARLRALAAAGARGVIEAMEPAPGRSARPIGSLVVVQMAPVELDRLLGDMREAAPGARDVQIQVAGTFEPGAAALNVLGYVAGRDPVLASELVIVGAAMDGPGRPAGATGPDTTHMGIAAAALLESARVLAGLAEEGRGPDRTVLFALWSGSLQTNAGARAWIRNPTWPRDATVRVVDVGSSSSEAFRNAGYDVVAIGSPTLDPGPGDPFARAIQQALTLARYGLVAAARDAWHRDGPDRIPPPADR